MDILVSGNLLKNGMGVGIPGTGEVGLPIAAALGSVCGAPEKGLEVLADVTPDFVKTAREMVDNGQVSIGITETDAVLYSEVLVTAGTDTARVIIRDDHTLVTRQERNGTAIHTPSYQDDKGRVVVPEMSIESIYEFATQADLDKLHFILKSAEINGALSKAGLKDDFESENRQDPAQQHQERLPERRSGRCGHDAVIRSLRCTYGWRDAAGHEQLRQW